MNTIDLPNLTFLHILSWFSDTQDDPCVADHDDDQGNQDGHTKNIKTLKYQLVQVLVKEVLGLPHYCFGRRIDNKASRELGIRTHTGSGQNFDCIINKSPEHDGPVRVV